jgi:excisionase family DNA binding protein
VPELLTVRELAGYLKLNPATVMRKAARGDLPAIKIGRQFRFDKEQIDKWLAAKTVGKPVNILVIDDEPVIGRVFKKGLASNGYQVTTITNGLEAIKLVTGKQYNLIFLDLLMPEIDGFAVFKHIRKIDKNVPIVIITGYPDSDLLGKIMEQGPFMVLKKPLNIEDIRKTIHSVIEGANQ